MSIYVGPSFQVYTDSLLTIPFSGTLQVTHKQDLSDNPQDFNYYFGSTATSTQLQATSNPGVDNIVLTPTYVLPTRAVSTAYVVGDSVISGTGNGYRYECTTAGTSSSGTPAWGVTIGGTTADGTVVWTLISSVRAVTEIKLAATSGDLATAVAGASLSLGNTITSGVANAKSIYIRITNAITTVSDNFGTPEIGININQVQETGV